MKIILWNKPLEIGLCNKAVALQVLLCPSLIGLSLMCGIGIKASLVFFTTTLSINKIASIIFLILFTIFSLIHILINFYNSVVKRKYG
ncbi:hypothetical protein [Acinetobacter baumannii]|uniref:hypothetical protein n=3 Tax=Acinetobacter baumannii TaxID=470 RepID=UPI001E42DCA0|nr:hypothetical protein [Acinetobacter baumannii]